MGEAALTLYVDPLASLEAVETPWRWLVVLLA
jgi:hypothetical protein